MKTRKYFTLVELLVVAGIIALLAGLILPAVIGGAQQGRITQAKSDMNSIQMALSQMDQTYNRILKLESGGASAKFLKPTDAITSVEQSLDSALTTDIKTTKFIVLGPKDNKHNLISGDKKFSSDREDAYNAFIAELTLTGGTGTYKQNLRKIKFLEPNKNFDPSKNYYDADNLPHLWRDPWGNPYAIMINIDGTDRLVKPDTPSTGKYIMTKTAVYSRGPNGEDNQGKNANEGGDKLDDDIATWHK
jgi:type II secretory pathway pseudopilin PulG